MTIFSHHTLCLVERLHCIGGTGQSQSFDCFTPVTVSARRTSVDDFSSIFFPATVGVGAA